MFIKEAIFILTCKLGDNIINCYNDGFSKDELKKWASKNILLCQACGKPYEYCHGKVRIPYFRHKDKVQCDALYSEPETDEHAKGKRDLYEWLKNQDGVTNVILEGWIPETKQRPDIMFVLNNKQFVVEFQCSPISTEYEERHNLYRAAGIIDIWICGTKKYFQYYHTSGGEKLLNLLEECCRLYYDVESKNIFNVISLDKKGFSSIEKGRGCNLMKTPSDYNEKKLNYFFIKKSGISFTKTYYYPSGRPSNKYRYPVPKFHYNINKSIALCTPLSSYQIENIDKVGKIL